MLTITRLIEMDGVVVDLKRAATSTIYDDRYHILEVRCIMAARKFGNSCGVLRGEAGEDAEPSESS